MKIENNPMLPLSAKPTETAKEIEKKEDLNEVATVRSGQDRLEMSDNARLLAKARTALGSVSDVNSDRVSQLKEQVANGSYTVRIGDLAKRLLSVILPK